MKSVARQEIVSKDNPIFELLFKSEEKWSQTFFSADDYLLYVHSVRNQKYVEI